MIYDVEKYILSSETIEYNTLYNPYDFYKRAKNDQLELKLGKKIQAFPKRLYKIKSKELFDKYDEITQPLHENIRDLSNPNSVKFDLGNYIFMKKRFCKFALSFLTIFDKLTRDSIHDTNYDQFIGGLSKEIEPLKKQQNVEDQYDGLKDVINRLKEKAKQQDSRVISILIYIRITIQIIIIIFYNTVISSQIKKIILTREQ